MEEKIIGKRDCDYKGKTYAIMAICFGALVIVSIIVGIFLVEAFFLAGILFIGMVIWSLMSFYYLHYIPKTILIVDDKKVVLCKNNREIPYSEIENVSSGHSSGYFWVGKGSIPYTYGRISLKLKNGELIGLKHVANRQELAKAIKAKMEGEKQ